VVKFLKALRQGSEWHAKLEKAKSIKEFRKVVNVLVKPKGYKVMKVEEIKSHALRSIMCIKSIRYNLVSVFVTPF